MYYAFFVWFNIYLLIFCLSLCFSVSLQSTRSYSDKGSDHKFGKNVSIFFNFSFFPDYVLLIHLIYYFFSSRGHGKSSTEAHQKACVTYGHIFGGKR